MKVSFIGLGVQGKYLAINLADAGHDLRVYDLRPEPLKELVSHGATFMPRWRQVFRNTRILWFFDTPWYCTQPCREPVDFSKSDERSSPGPRSSRARCRDSSHTRRGRPEMRQKMS